ncbi:MAG: glycyl-radical enzyme activating protein [Clostridia bacterium]|nr:glycyl-radical enzyme activating protein [Clostridia bacterium]
MRIVQIQRFCTHDGPGIRTSVFFKGCSLRCAWCHNPETWENEKEILFYQNKCIGCGECLCQRKICIRCGECAKKCPASAKEIAGEDYTPQELFEEIQKDFAFYGLGGGVTFSGGECMLQIDDLVKILTLCKEKKIHTAIDTAGHIPFENFEKVLPLTDLFLYDIKIFDPEKHRKYTGADNALILTNLKKLFYLGANVRIRIPIIPTVNDSEEEMRKIKDFLNCQNAPYKVDLLPYHPMGEGKFLALGKKTDRFQTPSREQILSLSKIFQED